MEELLHPFLFRHVDTGHISDRLNALIAENCLLVIRNEVHDDWKFCVVQVSCLNQVFFIDSLIVHTDATNVIVHFLSLEKAYGYGRCFESLGLQLEHESKCSFTFSNYQELSSYPSRCASPEHEK